MAEVQTSIGSFDELSLDLGIYGKILTEQSVNREELKKVIKDEFKRTHPLSPLENKRYKLSDIVSSDYHIKYEHELVMENNEEIVNFDLNGNDIVSVDELEEQYAIPRAKETHGYGVSGLDDIPEYANELEKVLGTVENKANTYDDNPVLDKLKDKVSDEEYEILKTLSDSELSMFCKKRGIDLNEEAKQTVQEVPKVVQEPKQEVHTESESPLEVSRGILDPSDFEIVSTFNDTELDMFCKKRGIDLKNSTLNKSDSSSQARVESREENISKSDDIKEEQPDFSALDDESDIRQASRGILPYERAIKRGSRIFFEPKEDDFEEDEENDFDDSEDGIDSEDDFDDADEDDFEEDAFDEEDDSEGDFEEDDSEDDFEEDDSDDDSEDDGDSDDDFEDDEDSDDDFEDDGDSDDDFESDEDLEDGFDDFEEDDSEDDDNGDSEDDFDDDEVISDTPSIKLEPEPVIREEPKPVIREEPKPVIREEPKPVIQEEPEPVIREEPEPVIQEEPSRGTVSNIKVPPTPFEMAQRNKEKPKQEVEVKETKVNREEEPKDIREFLRKHPRCDISFALQYFSKKEIQKNIMMGKIIRKGNKLHI